LDNPETRDRIDKFISCSSGFELAEYDFISRGAGDFLGYSQHGNEGGFVTDKEIILLAREISADMLQDEETVKTVVNSITGSKYEYFSGITLN
jgi:RecG-like helicase